MVGDDGGGGEIDKSVALPWVTVLRSRRWFVQVSLLVYTGNRMFDWRFLEVSWGIGTRNIWSSFTGQRTADGLLACMHVCQASLSLQSLFG